MEEKLESVLCVGRFLSLHTWFFFLSRLVRTGFCVCPSHILFYFEVWAHSSFLSVWLYFSNLMCPTCVLSSPSASSISAVSPFPSVPDCLLIPAIFLEMFLSLLTNFVLWLFVILPGFEFGYEQTIDFNQSWLRASVSKALGAKPRPE